MSASDFELFKQFQEFKKMKEMSEKISATPTFIPAPAPKSFAQILATPAPPTPPAPPAPPVRPAPPPTRVFCGASGSDKSSDDSLPTFRKTFKLDWEKIMCWTIKMTPHRGEGFSKHPNLYMLYRELHNEHPERYSLIGELHAEDDGRQYFSYRYQKPGDKCSTTFHAYGRLLGTKFFTDSVDIRIGCEAYPDAAKFNHEKWSNGSKEWADAHE